MAHPSRVGVSNWIFQWGTGRMMVKWARVMHSFMFFKTTPEKYIVVATLQAAYFITDNITWPGFTCENSLYISVEDTSHGLGLVVVEFGLRVAAEDGHGSGDLSVDMARVCGDQYLPITNIGMPVSYHYYQTRRESKFTFP